MVAGQKPHRGPANPRARTRVAFSRRVGIDHCANRERRLYMYIGGGVLLLIVIILLIILLL
jgi:hypothetical protein